jgi:integrase
MPRRPGIPTYRLHRQSGQAIVTIPDPWGNRSDHLLGPHGSAESHAEYSRLISEWQARGGRRLLAGRTDLTVAELMVAFWEHAEEHYRLPDGTPTSELGNFKLAFRPLKALYAHTLVADFGPVALRAVREEMIRGGASRKVINKWVNRVRHVFKWGTSLELVPVSVYGALKTVPPLAAGRTCARETEPVKPVPEVHVSAILPHLRPQTRAIVELLKVTGMRPGEAVRMRPMDLDRSAPVWHYKPEQHKTRWKGFARVVPIGPKGQAVLTPFLDRAPSAFLFSPREALRSLFVEQRSRRRSKVYPSQRRDWEKRLKTVGEVYSVNQLDKAIERAVVKENARRLKLAGEGRFDEVHHWSANQLRHLHATLVRKRYGLEAAQVVLGHAKADVTQVYAERDGQLAAKVAAEIG